MRRLVSHLLHSGCCLLLLSAQPLRAGDKASELVYIGTHGAGKPQQGQDTRSPQGIYAARLDTRTGHLSPLGLQVELERATWLVTHPSLPVIYAVADSGGGSSTESNIHSFAMDPASGKLTQINKVGAGGLDATHMDLDVASKTLFVANHGSGDVTALPLQADGSLGKVVSSQKDYGTGPNPRQKMPEAHGVAADPSHRYIVVADFGADRIFVYHFDRATRILTPAQVPYESTPSGSGPRHLVFHPNEKFLYLDTELTAELRVYRWDANKGSLHLVQSLSAYPASYSGAEKSAAEIAVSGDGRFLYVSLRGDQDSIVVYAVNKQAGTLKEIQRISSQGKTPWSFGVDPTGHWMLVTNEASNSVTVFSIAPATGKLSVTNESLSIPKPVTVAFHLVQ
jgi:6-phosphogluconolactonase